MKKKSSLAFVGFRLDPYFTAGSLYHVTWLRASLVAVPSDDTILKGCLRLGFLSPSVKPSLSRLFNLSPFFFLISQAAIFFIFGKSRRMLLTDPMAGWPKLLAVKFGEARCCGHPLSLSL